MIGKVCKEYIRVTFSGLGEFGRPWGLDCRAWMNTDSCAGNMLPSRLRVCGRKSAASHRRLESMINRLPKLTDELATKRPEHAISAGHRLERTAFNDLDLKRQDGDPREEAIQTAHSIRRTKPYLRGLELRDSGISEHRRRPREARPLRPHHRQLPVKRRYPVIKIHHAGFCCIERVMLTYMWVISPLFSMSYHRSRSFQRPFSKRGLNAESATHGHCARRRTGRHLCCPSWPRSISPGTRALPPKNRSASFMLTTLCGELKKPRTSSPSQSAA